MYSSNQQPYAFISLWIRKSAASRRGEKVRAAGGGGPGGGSLDRGCRGRAEPMESGRPWGEGERLQGLRRWTIQLQDGRRSSAGFWATRWPTALSGYWTASGGARWNWQKY